MEPIGMPVRNITADCIWNSFRASGKRHLLITGSRGSGKSTLLNALAPQSLPGVTTWTEPGKAVHLRENRTGRETIIGLFDFDCPGVQNKMQPAYYGFAALAVPALKNCLQDENPWVRIDEIGYLELGCREYCQGLLALFEQKRVMAVVRRQDAPFLNALLSREDAFVVDLDAPFGNAGCVIMASGLGKRFGGSKLLVPFQGKPLLFWALDATEGLFSRRVVVTRSEAAAEACRSRGVETVLHTLPARSDTVRLGLEAVGEVQNCLFCPADQPLLSKKTVASLLLCGRNSAKMIWRPCWQDTPGAPILFPRDYFGELGQLPPGKGGGFVAANHRKNVCLLPVENKWELFDIDTPEDLQKIGDSPP